MTDCKKFSQFFAFFFRLPRDLQEGLMNIETVEVTLLYCQVGFGSPNRRQLERKCNVKGSSRSRNASSRRELYSEFIYKS